MSATYNRGTERVDPASRNTSLVTERKATNDAWRATNFSSPNGSKDVRVISPAEIGFEGCTSAGQCAFQITAMVAEVWPNGNLIAEGRKQLSLTEGEFIQIRGAYAHSRTIQCHQCAWLKLKSSQNTPAESTQLDYSIAVQVLAAVNGALSMRINNHTIIWVSTFILSLVVNTAQADRSKI